MSNPQTRLESIRPSVREDLRYVTDLLGRDPEPSTDFRVWNDATTRLQRVTAAFEALDDQPLAQLGKASLEFAHLLASQQFDDASEASQRLLATLQILADHSHRVSASSTNRDDTHWHQHLSTHSVPKPQQRIAPTKAPFTIRKITELRPHNMSRPTKSRYSTG